jgi:hypothetical protein
MAQPSLLTGYAAFQQGIWQQVASSGAARIRGDDGFIGHNQRDAWVRMSEKLEQNLSRLFVAHIGCEPLLKTADGVITDFYRSRWHEHNYAKKIKLVKTCVD